MEQLPPSGQADDYSELSLEEQLSRAEMKLAILYNQFRLIAGNIDEDPYF